MAPAKYRLKPGVIKKLMFLKSAELGEQVTYGDIAEGAGVSWNTVERYANDKIIRPSMDVVISLAAYFGVDVTELLEVDAGEGKNAVNKKEASAINEEAHPLRAHNIIGQMLTALTSNAR